MDKTYNKFLKLGIDLTCVGIEMRDNEAAYFCTPRGASIIDRAGADGIHYCRVRGFGNMIFAVSPMNIAPDYVHPIAEDFEALLRLLLACGDAAALEQAWQWNENEFNAFLSENQPTAEMNAVLSQISEKLNLSPIDNPWQYLHSLQESFDYSKIKYTEDISDPDMNAAAKISAPEWKVYFDGNIDGSFWGHHGKARAGKEIRIDKQFEWAGRNWLIPAAYSCSKGLVVDFCIRVEAEKIRSFMNKWDLSRENYFDKHFTKEQQMEMDYENPMNLNFTPEAEVNGRKLKSSRGSAVNYDPCLFDGVIGDVEAWVIDHYGLDTDCGWVIWRRSFPWESKRRPEIKTLSLTMEQQPERIPGPRFKIRAPGDCFSFVHPISGTEYTLTVQEAEQQTLPDNSFSSDGWSYPTHFTAVSYTLSPETSASITINDCEYGDKPRKIAPSEDQFPRSDACVCFIGGADGPTVLLLGESKPGNLRTACSSLYFEPIQHDIEWHVTFNEKRFEDFYIKLISG